MGTSTIKLRQVEKHMMAITDSHGYAVVAGRSPDPEHQWAGVKPSDLLLMSAASCSAYDIIEILGKQREPLEDLQVVCTGEQMEEQPYAYTSIHMHYVVKGAVNPDKLERAIKLSEEKYCSVLATLRHGVALSSDYELIS